MAVKKHPDKGGRQSSFVRPSDLFSRILILPRPDNLQLRSPDPSTLIPLQMRLQSAYFGLSKQRSSTISLGQRHLETYKTSIKKTKEGFRMSIKMGQGGRIVVLRVMADVEEKVLICA